MKIKDNNKFFFGLVLAILSYIPFSYMNHAEKYKIENCDMISGELTQMEKTYAKGGKRQDGWLLKIKDFEFDIRIVGEYYNAINQKNFDELIKPGALLNIYILKTKYYGIFEKLNNSMNIKDAATIICSNKEVLDLKSIRNRLKHLFVMNLIFGMLAVGFGVKLIFESIKRTDTINSI
jgi:hypothetical protein